MGSKPAAAARGAHEVRIVGGQWKRSKLAVPDRPGLRPTPDRVRETLFNWLGQDLTGWRCIDPFAGSGALGFEAASRGAAHALLIEQDAQAVRQLQQARLRLQAGTVEVRRGDGLAALRQAAGQALDLVLLDPPFEAGLYEPALRAARACVAPTGRVYLEAPEAWSTARLAACGFTLARHLRAGAVHAHLLGPADAALHNAAHVAGEAPCPTR